MKTFKLVKPSKYGNILLNDITSMRNFPKCPICPTETTQNQDHIKTRVNHLTLALLLCPRIPFRRMNRSKNSLWEGCLLHVAQCSVINNLGLFDTFLCYKAIPCIWKEFIGKGRKHRHSLISKKWVCFSWFGHFV